MNRNQKWNSILFAFLLLSATCLSQTRYVQDLSNHQWKIVLDKQAIWEKDPLYLPPVDLKQLPVNLPSGGWEMLEKSSNSVTTTLPATVEEFFWGKSGSSFGVTGNYLGVSWFTTKFKIPQSLKGKRITLHFESVRFRAEVFLNRTLVGYDIVNSTPFEVDITHAAKFGKENELAVRITDPNGNFDWRDSRNFMWGNYRTIPSHGFGGITGKITLVATDSVYISDIFIKNKPSVNEIDVEVTTENLYPASSSADCELLIYEWNNPAKIIFKKNYNLEILSRSSSLFKTTIKVENPRLWSPDSPSLYVLQATIKGPSFYDRYQQRFGFRWFEILTVDGDKQFYLNGKRIVLFTAISWGFWPYNGIAPTDELAKKQILAAKKLGLNMLNFHRTIGNTNVLTYADELGLLYFEEPGGYQFPYDLFEPRNSLEEKQRNFYIPCRREKLFRMIKRDRNHPSLIIYNLHNERAALPSFQDSIDMRDAHRLDETRILTYNSCNGEIKTGPDPQFKLHMLPYDTNFYDYGWFDQHHAGGPGTYHNGIYNSPTNFLRYTDKKDEIIYWGEEGAIGTPPRLQLIVNDIRKRGKTTGWETECYITWYKAYDDFLKKQNFTKAFKDVDALTTAIGNVAYYYQGRVLENIRINNIADGYAINGWESMKLENHSGIVDNYRNFKGNPELISRYLQPLYIAVKIPKKVTSVFDTVDVDFFIVNEVDLKGEYTLRVTVTDSFGLLTQQHLSVRVSGGNIYGELLKDRMQFQIRQSGYTTVKAELLNKSDIITSGQDDIFAVDLTIPAKISDGMIADTTGTLQAFFKSLSIPFTEYTKGTPTGKWLIVGAFPPPPDRQLVTDLLEWVNNGNTLIVVGNVEKWAEHLAQKEIADYRGSQILGRSWYGGNFFVKHHPLFDGLPQACAFNWEYQCFATYDRTRIGLRLFNGETIVGCVSDHKKEVYSALSIIPTGRGNIILSSLDFYACIKDSKPKNITYDAEGQNAALRDLGQQSRRAANIVGHKLLINLLRYADK